MRFHLGNRHYTNALSIKATPHSAPPAIFQGAPRTHQPPPPLPPRPDKAFRRDRHTAGSVGQPSWTSSHAPETWSPARPFRSKALCRMINYIVAQRIQHGGHRRRVSTASITVSAPTKPRGQLVPTQCTYHGGGRQHGVSTADIRSASRRYSADARSVTAPGQHNQPGGHRSAGGYGYRAQRSDDTALTPEE